MEFSSLSVRWQARPFSVCKHVSAAAWISPSRLLNHSSQTSLLSAWKVSLPSSNASPSEAQHPSLYLRCLVRTCPAERSLVVYVDSKSIYWTPCLLLRIHRLDILSLKSVPLISHITVCSSSPWIHTSPPRSVKLQGSHNPSNIPLRAGRMWNQLPPPLPS